MERSYNEHTEKKHMVNFHGEDINKVHKCETCDKIFKQKCHLLLHVEVAHEKKRPFQCPNCDKRYSTKALMKAHNNTIHEKLYIVRCEVCDKGFINQRNFQTHVSIVHEKKRPHQVPLIYYARRRTPSLIFLNQSLSTEG